MHRSWAACLTADNFVAPPPVPFLFWNRLPCMCFLTASRDLSMSWPVKAQYSMFLCGHSSSMIGAICSMKACGTVPGQVCASLVWQGVKTHSREIGGLQYEGLILFQDVLRIVALLQLGKLAATADREAKAEGS